MRDSFKTRTTLAVGSQSYEIHQPACDRRVTTSRDCPSRSRSCSRTCCASRTASTSRATTSRRCSSGIRKAAPSHEIAFTPARVIMQDFTGVPAIVDLAAMREAMIKLGGNPQEINPLAPAELVIDHSVQVDEYGAADSLLRNNADRVRAQRRALRVPALGSDRVQQLQGRAAEHRHRAPGQPRAPGPRRLRRGEGRRAARVPRHAGRHRFAHDDGQRPRRAGLGRRRHRGGSRDARASRSPC